MFYKIPRMLAGVPAAGSELLAGDRAWAVTPTHAAATPAIGWRPIHAQFAPSLCRHPLAVIPSEWPLMDNRGRELYGTWAFFFAPRARIVSRALWPTAYLSSRASAWDVRRAV